MADREFRRAFVTGWPINHSRSPLIHNHWINEHNLAGRYERVPCEPEALADFLRSLAEHGFAGGNITLPHKQAAFDLVDDCDAAARSIGAVNTVWFEGEKLMGSNTDAYGFAANLDAQAPGWNDAERLRRGALVLGAGGAARAIIQALMQRGFSKVVIANRTVAKAENLAVEFGGPCSATAIAHLPRDVSFIVNTTSVGMGDGKSPVSLEDFAPDLVVNDIVYTPLVTPLLQDAARRGMKTVGGLGMLLHQAVPGFEKWFGIRPAVTRELQTLVEKDLAAST